MSWLSPHELRVGLGCMRLHDAAPIAAAMSAGVTVFDTARAYSGNERMLADALRGCDPAGRARIVTKGGMTRPGEAWVPDGRARSIVRDCDSSLEALGGLPIDLYLLHAPDPRTPWATSVRALARLVDAGLVARVGLCNVNRDQLEVALALAPIAAVQVAVSPFDDRALRGGLVERCAELGITVIAHSPLGGPRRGGRHPALAEAATAHRVAPAEIALAWLLGLSPALVAIPGATRPETARSAARAATLRLSAAELGLLRPAPRRAPAPTVDSDADVVLIMGIPGAGKTRVAERYVARGYVRLNRDERGGGLRGLAEALEAELSAGRRRVVLDNTYLTRALRSYVLEVAARHGAPVRCVWCHTPLADAQVNLVARLLAQFGALPGPDALRGREPGVMAPTAQMRALRELEEPAREEGFAELEVLDFQRVEGAGRPGVFVAATALAAGVCQPEAPHLVFDWRPGAAADALDGDVAWLADRVAGPVRGAVCGHGGGPPRCWCRPPLPGLALEFAHAHGLEPAHSTVVGTSSAHRALAAALGARFVAAVP